VPFEPKIVEPHEQPPNDANLQSGKFYNYTQTGFPEKLNKGLYMKPRAVKLFNKEEQRPVYKSLTTNEDIGKMNDPEWARYNAEIIYCLWFQVLGATMPKYGQHSNKMINFALDLLKIIQRKLNPMRESEIIYRRLFEVCGIC